MQRMLEAYLAFARGDAGESAAEIDIEEFLEDLRLDAERAGFDTKIAFQGDPIVTLRPNAFKRCLANLISNAQNHAKHISIEAVRDQRFLTVHVDDDGPGIPLEPARGCVPAVLSVSTVPAIRTKAAPGLGLRSRATSRARMAATSALGDSKAGGLRATVRVPV